jgi:hypothetical protein
MAWERAACKDEMNAFEAPPNGFTQAARGVMEAQKIPWRKSNVEGKAGHVAHRVVER